MIAFGAVVSLVKMELRICPLDEDQEKILVQGCLRKFLSSCVSGCRHFLWGRVSVCVQGKLDGTPWRGFNRGEVPGWCWARVIFATLVYEDVCLLVVRFHLPFPFGQMRSGLCTTSSERYDHPTFSFSPHLPRPFYF